MELMNCPSLAVPKEVMHHVVRVESSYNPYAIGVVGGHLARQPKTVREALATVRMLEAKGYNFSLGLAQVNRYNLDKYGIDSYEKAFDVCPNLRAGSRILADCHSRSGGDWGKSFSCYYSGNFVTGYRHGYVQKIFASMRDNAASIPSVDGPIHVIDKPSRKAVQVARSALYPNQHLGTFRTQAEVPVSTRNTKSKAVSMGGASADVPVQNASTAALEIPQHTRQTQPVDVNPVAQNTQSPIDVAFVF